MSDKEQEPVIGGVLGRAMERTRRGGAPPISQGKRRDEFRGSASDLLRTPQGQACMVLLTLGGTVFWFSFPRGGPVNLIVAVWTLALLAYAPVLLVKVLPAAWFGVVVGVDGLFVRGRFIRHSRILAVHHARRRASQDEGDVRHRWKVSIDLDGGEEVILIKGTSHDMKEGPGIELVRTLEEARSSWLASRCLADLEDGVVERGSMTGAEWLHGLRCLARSAMNAYRAANVDLERVSRLLDDEGAKPSARIAAAVVLTSAGEPTARRRLRIAAEAIANPRLRVAMKGVAEAEDDASLAAALEEASDADRQARLD